MKRGPYSALALVCLCLPVARLSAAEWDDLKARYRFCTVLAGLGAANGSNNPNEWNNAEGLPALNAELSEPHSAMADLYGRVFIADKNAHAIRRIDLDGSIHTVAGMNLGEIEGSNAGYNGDGDARECLLNGPQNAYVLPDGTFYILDSLNRRIRRVGTDGALRTVITDGSTVNRGLWVSRDEQLVYYCTNSELKRWVPSLGNSSGVSVCTGFAQTGNIDVDPLGNIYVSDREGCAVYRVPPNYGGFAVSDTMRVAGLGGGSTTDSGAAFNGMPATQVGMREVRGVAFHPLGGFFTATHRGGDVWYVDTGGRAWLFVEGNNGNVHNPNAVPVPTANIIMSEPRSVTVSRSGDVLIACNDAGYIRIVRSILPSPPAPRWETSALQSGTGLRLRWQSTPGEWFLLERSTGGLTGDNWSALSTLPAAASGMTTEFTDPSAAASPRTFYRLRSFLSWPN